MSGEEVPLFHRLSNDVVSRVFDFSGLDSAIKLWITGSSYILARLSSCLASITKRRQTLTSIPTLFQFLPLISKLHSLSINTVVSSETLSLFKGFPLQLISLELALPCSLDLLVCDCSGRIRSPSEVSSLFPLLKSLVIYMVESEATEEQLNALQLLKLESLSFVSGMIPVRLTPLFPSSLTSLKLSITPDLGFTDWKDFTLPAGLLSLVIVGADESVLLERLPPNLTHLRIQSNPKSFYKGPLSFEASSSLCKLLPRTLTDLDAGEISLCFNDEVTSQLPPSLLILSLKHVEFTSDAWRHLPPRLLSFEIIGNRVASPTHVAHWPRSLTSFSISDFFPKDERKDLPPNIRNMDVVISDVSDNEDLILLPRRLEMLICYSIPVPDFLKHLNLPELKKLALFTAADEDLIIHLNRFPLLEELSPFKVQHFSHMSHLCCRLHTLHIYSNERDIEQLDLTRPWASSLTHLNLSVEHAHPLPNAAKWLQDLPRSLRMLCAKGADITVSILHHLPQNLSSLQLGVSDFSNVTQYALFPRSLTELRLFKAASVIRGSILELASALPLYISQLSAKSTKLTLDDPPAGNILELIRPLRKKRPALVSFTFPGSHPSTTGSPFILHASLSVVSEM